MKFISKYYNYFIFPHKLGWGEILILICMIFSAIVLIRVSPYSLLFGIISLGVREMFLNFYKYIYIMRIKNISLVIKGISSFFRGVIIKKLVNNPESLFTKFFYFYSTLFLGLRFLFTLISESKILLFSFLILTFYIQGRLLTSPLPYMSIVFPLWLFSLDINSMVIAGIYKENKKLEENYFNFIMGVGGKISSSFPNSTNHNESNSRGGRHRIFIIIRKMYTRVVTAMGMSPKLAGPIIGTAIAGTAGFIAHELAENYRQEKSLKADNQKFAISQQITREYRELSGDDPLKQKIDNIAKTGKIE